MNQNVVHNLCLAFVNDKVSKQLEESKNLYERKHGKEIEDADISGKHEQLNWRFLFSPLSLDLSVANENHGQNIFFMISRRFWIV